MKLYPHPVTGCFIVNIFHEILLVRSPKWEKGLVWAVPGGHVEWGEQIGASAEREAMEEVGLKVEFEQVFAVYDAIFPKEFHQKMHFIFLECLCRVESRPTPKVDQTEITLAQWFKPSELPKLKIQTWVARAIAELQAKSLLQ